MIHIVLDSLPPSANNAYFTKGHVRVLSSKGKKYKKDVVNHLVKNHGPQLKELKKDVTIGCLIAYGFPEIFNKGYPKTATTRFKKNDLMNRPKLLQDAIVEATSMDDSQICFDYKYKYQSEKEQTTIYIWNEDDEPLGSKLIAAFATLARCT